MQPNKNPYEGMPLHQYLFLCVRDGGLGARTSVAELHGITVDELKAHCKRAGEEILAERGEFLVYEKPVYEWACSR
ncbi:hypothetical protein D3C71_1080320 [compost metagenome]